jgi:predicted translin family RNA/ssDNA-binding protein
MMADFSGDIREIEQQIEIARNFLHMPDETAGFDGISDALDEMESLVSSLEDELDELPDTDDISSFVDNAEVEMNDIFNSLRSKIDYGY